MRKLSAYIDLHIVDRQNVNFQKPNLWSMLFMITIFGEKLAFFSKTNAMYDPIANCCIR
jgi:hypothetical protein